MFHSWIQKEADVPELGAKQTERSHVIARDGYYLYLHNRNSCSDDKEQIQY